jgi:MEDS: MEthanogen/methylotroph, DcmR Sensory domain
LPTPPSNSNNISNNIQVDKAISLLSAAKYGDHDMLVYPDLDTFRKIYVEFTKKQLDDNGVVLLAPHYETTDSVRENLSKAGIDVKKCEQDCSLVIIDSVRAYFHSSIDINSLLKTMIEDAKRKGKKGVSIMDDMGSFFLYRKQKQMLNFEVGTDLGNRDKSMIKGICVYHKGNFNTLSDHEQQELLEHHDKNLFVYN